MRRALLAMFIITAMIASCRPAVVRQPRLQSAPFSWILPNEAKDSDKLCIAFDQQDTGLRRCRTVGEVRVFLRSMKATLETTTP